jgi:hypothetical protein
MRQLGKRFVCYGNGGGDRIFYYASFLLTYSLALDYAEPGFPSKFKVFPEELLVAEAPVVPDAQVTTATDLRSSTGVYVREYAVCFFSGKRIGHCAAIVNPSSTSAHDYPVGLRFNYAHTLGLAGSGVLEGGWATTHGPRPPSTMKPASAVIAVE